VSEKRKDITSRADQLFSSRRTQAQRGSFFIVALGQNIELVVSLHRSGSHQTHVAVCSEIAGFIVPSCSLDLLYRSKKPPCNIQAAYHACSVKLFQIRPTCQLCEIILRYHVVQSDRHQLKPPIFSMYLNGGVSSKTKRRGVEFQAPRF